MKNNNKRLITTACCVVLATSFIAFGINYKTSRKVTELNNTITQLTQKSTITNKDLKKTINTLNTENKKLTVERDKLDSDNASLRKSMSNLYLSPKWNSNDVTTPSNANAIGMKMALKGTGLQGTENAFVEAEHTYGVNAIFLASLVAQESGWGNSARAKNDNNLSGFEVYSDASRGASFNSKSESIMKTAQLIKEDYVNKGLKDIKSINRKYCPVNGYSWSEQISQIINTISYDADLNHYNKGVNMLNVKHN